MSSQEQGLLSNLLDSSPDRVYFKDRSSRFIRVSKSQAFLFGAADPADVIGKTDFDFFSEEHAVQAFTDEQEIIRTGQPVSKEEKETWADRPDTWVLTTKMPLYGEDGTIVGTFGISKDVTERKQIEDALRSNQTMLSDAVKIAHLGYWEYDIAADLFIFNDPFYEIFRTTAEREGGYTMSSARYAERLVYPGDKDIVANEIQKILTSTEPVYSMQVEHKIRYSDGNIGYISVRSTSIRDEHGTLVKTVGVIQDITERKRAEEETEKRAIRSEALAHISQLLSTSTTSYSTLMDNLSHLGSGLVNGAFAIHLISEDGQWLEPVALSLSERLKQRCGVAVPANAEKLPIHHSVYGRVLQSGEVAFYLQIPPNQFPELISPDTERWLEGFTVHGLVIAPLKAQGSIIGTLSAYCLTSEYPFTDEDVILFESIADHVAMAIANARLLRQIQQQNMELEKRVNERTAQLLRSNEDLVRASLVKDEFLANMSHELRTPLNAILTLSESLEEGIYGPLLEQQAKRILTIAESGQHLLDLINDILDLSKIEAGKVKFHSAPVDIHTLCNACLRMIDQQAVKKNLQVTLEIDASVNIIQGNERYLKQILVNLLSNAVKFTPENGKVGLCVKGDGDQDIIHFTVWDNGIGIAPEYLGRLFKPFVQVDSSLSRQYEGTGLGLALVAHLVELHSGSVSVESDPSVGSRFTVSLPWEKEAVHLPGYNPRNHVKSKKTR